MRSNASRATPCLLLAAACLAAAGCNNGRQLQTDLYQRELRLQEDEIYRLEDYVEDYQAIIRAYRCEVAELKSRLRAEERAAESIDATPGLRSEPLTPPDQSGSILTTPEPEDIEELIESPELEFSAPETPVTPPGDLPNLDEAPAFDAAPPFEPGPTDSGALRQAAPEEPRPLIAAIATGEDATSIEAVAAAESVGSDRPPAPFPPTTYPETKRLAAPRPETISPAAGEPASVDGARLMIANGPAEPGGAPTLLATVTPLSGGAVAPFTGGASLMLTDPAAEGGERRIARWDYSEQEVAEAFRTASEPAAGEFLLMMPEAAPTDRPLRLWVRLVNDRGRKTLRAIEIELMPNPLRLVDSRPLASNEPPRRLPTPGQGADDEAVDGAHDGASAPVIAGSGWRRAIAARHPGATARGSARGGSVMRDTAVKPAAFFAEAE